MPVNCSVGHARFLVAALSALFSKLFLAGSGWQKLNLLGFLPGIADWLENIGIISLIINYPNQLSWLVNITNVFTMAKFLLGILILLMILGGGVILLMRRRNSTAKINRRT